MKKDSQVSRNLAGPQQNNPSRICSQPFLFTVGKDKLATGISDNVSLYMLFVYNIFSWKRLEKD